MAILGNILKKGLVLSTKIRFPEFNPVHQQNIQLRKLLKKAKDTEFGQFYDFADILKSNRLRQEFASRIPVFDYVTMNKAWWHKAQEGLEDIAWPGAVKYFALSSGTSDSASKYIPVTSEMIKAMRRASLKQMYALAQYNLPANLFEKGMLMLGGSTHLNFNGTYFYGDLSGINTSKIPFWFQHFYKPGRKISATKDWNLKLQEIADNAYKWDIWVVAGVPAWIQILLEKIIAQYKLTTIHDIWPNLTVYAHGGVAMEPYRKKFELLLGKPIIYFETYLASEGFIAYDARRENKGMRLITNNGIYYEFIPFPGNNFTPDGNLVENPEVLRLDQVKENVDYALLITTCSGAWRYLIGDVIRFTSLEKSEIKIVGRTKHYISLCGEHLSVDNMNQAIKVVSETLDIPTFEFTVIGENHKEGMFLHHWYIGTDRNIDVEQVKDLIDKTLMEVNDDYAVERTAALKDVIVDTIPHDYFIEWMALKGKLGGQHKFPRVLNGLQAQEWRSFLTGKDLRNK